MLNLSNQSRFNQHITWQDMLFLYLLFFRFGSEIFSQLESRTWSIFSSKLFILDPSLSSRYSFTLFSFPTYRANDIPFFSNFTHSQSIRKNCKYIRELHSTKSLDHFQKLYPLTKMVECQA